MPRRDSDNELKLAKVQGEFVWHQHDDTDEVFLVLDGELTIDLPDGSVVLGPRDIVTIPVGCSTVPEPSPRPRSCWSSLWASSTQAGRAGR